MIKKNNYKILIIKTSWHKKIIDNLSTSAINILKNYSVCSNFITVSGTFEIPLVIEKNIKNYDAVITLGCLIKGKTLHFETISYSVVNEISKLIIKHKKPIGLGIIMALSLEDAIKRSIIDSPKNYGYVAAKAILKSLNIL